MGPARLLYRTIRDRERIRSVTVDGYELYYPSRSRLGHHLELGRGWDSVLRPIVADLVESGDLIVEVGANIGASLVQMKLGRPDAHVICIEPSRRYVRLLRRTVRENHWTDVRIDQRLLGRAPGRGVLYTNTRTASAVADSYDGQEFVEAAQLPVETLDGVMVDEHVAFLKIDTDGSDYDVLLGARAMLARSMPPIFFEFEPSLMRRAGHEPENAIMYLQHLGYEQFLVFSQFGEALETTRASARIVELAGRGDYVDVLALHRGFPNAHERLEHLRQEIGSGHSIRET